MTQVNSLKEMQATVNKVLDEVLDKAGTIWDAKHGNNFPEKRQMFINLFFITMQEEFIKRLPKDRVNVSDLV